jgi:endonuclease-3
MERAFVKKQQKRALEMLKRLEKHNPGARIALTYGNPIQLLVAVMLSAQCTDKKVNEVTEKLFQKYKTVEDFASANPRIFEREIKSTGFYRAKAKNIIAAAKMIRDKFGGKLPRTIEEMVQLPGVGRKTANIVLGNAYGIVEGIAVDTHVRRLAQHFGWTKEKDPDKIERDLMKLWPKKYWLKGTYLLQNYGRTICTARRCGCKESFLKDFLRA